MIIMGIPGDPPVVTISDDDGLRELDGGPFAWGGKRDPAKAAPMHALSRAILLEVLDDPQEANRMKTRFTGRALQSMSADDPLSMSTAQAMAIVNAIRETETASAGFRSQIAMQPPPVENDSIMNGKEGLIAPKER